MNNSSSLFLVGALAVLWAFCPSTVTASGKSPDDYLAKFVEGEEIVWFGEVVSARAFKNERNETVIEWLCLYYELAESIDVDTYAVALKNKEMKSPIRARKNTKEQYFVATIRSLEMPLDLAKETVSEIRQKKHYALRRAQTVYIGEYEGKHAIYIGGGSGSIGDGVKVVFVDEKQPN